MTNGTPDPAQQWPSLLAPLTGRRHEAVVSALRSSAEQGWPADAEGVRLLVAYAMGDIDAQDYAVGIVVSLGGDEALVRAQTAPGVMRPAGVTQYDDNGLASVPPVQPAPLSAAPATSAPAVSRDEAVAAYVSGRISVEEFLRVTRGVA